MIDPTPTLALLSRALDVSALKQSVYATNVANAGVPGYQRLEVSFDQALEQASMQGGAARMPAATSSTTVFATHEAVKLDEEVGLMAKNALRYQILLGAVERSTGALQLAIREGRE